MITLSRIYFEKKNWQWSYTFVTVAYYYMHIWVLTYLSVKLQDVTKYVIWKEKHQTRQERNILSDSTHIPKSMAMQFS